MVRLNTVEGLIGWHSYKDGQRNDNGNPNHSAQCWHVGNHCSR